MDANDHSVTANERLNKVPIPVGVVVAVYNEEKTLPLFLEHFEQQEGISDVVCLAMVDGNSEDRSMEILKAWQMRLPIMRIISNPQRITPVAFNLGVKACLDAGADAITIASAHSWLADEFIAALQRSLHENDADILGAVHSYPDPESNFDRAIQAYSESLLGRRLGYLTRMTSPTPTQVAYSPTIKRKVFTKIGCFDESLARNQDNDFTTRAAEHGLLILTDPALRYTYIPRKNISGLIRQMYGNGYGVGLRPNAHGIKYFMPLLFWLFILMVVFLTTALDFPWQIAVSPLLIYCIAIFLETISWIRRARLGVLWLPILFLVGHVSYAIGTLFGIINYSRGRSS